MYLTLHFHCSVFLILLSILGLCQPNLQPNLQFHHSFPSPFIMLASERASSFSYLPSFFYVHFSPVSPVSSRPCFQTCPFSIILPTQIPSFLILSSAHQGMTVGLVPTALSIPPSYSLRVSTSDPPQDLTLCPQGYRIRGNPRAFPAHDCTVHLRTLRHREVMMLSAEDSHCSPVL